MSKKSKSETKKQEESFDVDTMQDDIAGLISDKNKKKSKKRRVGQKSDDKKGEKQKVDEIKEDKPEEDEEDKIIQRNLAEVYTNSDGDIPDLSKLERTQNKTWKTVIYTLIGVLIVILILAIAGFFFF